VAEKLLPKIPRNIFVTSHDFFDKRQKRPLYKFRFRVSAYGILKVGNKILLQRHPLLSKFGVPGGGIGMGESITQGLYREYEEETGLKVKRGKLLDVDEDYFTSGGEDVHGIFIYYEVLRTGGKMLKDGNGSDTAELKFIDIKDLNQGNVQKVFWGFLKEYIKGTKSKRMTT